MSEPPDTPITGTVSTVREQCVRGAVTGLWYAWDRAHIVNLRRIPDGANLDVYFFGDFGQDREAEENFLASVRTREEAER